MHLDVNCCLLISFVFFSSLFFFFSFFRLIFLFLDVLWNSIDFHCYRNCKDRTTPFGLGTTKPFFFLISREPMKTFIWYPHTRKGLAEFVYCQIEGELDISIWKHPELALRRRKANVIANQETTPLDLPFNPCISALESLFFF